MIENGKSSSQRMNKGNFAGPRGLVETCARGKAIANSKAWRTGAMTRTRSNFRIGYLNVSGWESEFYCCSSFHKSIKSLRNNVVSWREIPGGTAVLVIGPFG